jgi:hypothetical protein
VEFYRIRQQKYYRPPLQAMNISDLDKVYKEPVAEKKLKHEIPMKLAIKDAPMNIDYAKLCLYASACFP